MNFILVFLGDGRIDIVLIMYIHHDGKRHQEKCRNANARQKGEGKRKTNLKKLDFKEYYKIQEPT